jgi:sirohydrochlorin ferrochelatase
VIGHGSSVAAANRVLYRIAAALRRRFPRLVVEAAFLEAAAPDVQAGVDRCVARGARRIVLLPYFLYLGGHVARDLPRAMALARRRHPGLRVAAAPHLGYDPRLVATAAGRARAALRRRRWD